MSRENLRTTFGEDAELYDRVRPAYPAELFDDLAGLVGDRPQVLEIGPGTGQATAALVERGWSVTAVELSPRLAEVLRRKQPTVEVVVADFDTWELPAGEYDLVVSATAFHWLDPTTRVARCADLLRPGGALAIVSTHHVAGGSEQFFTDVQTCYDRFTTTRRPTRYPPRTTYRRTVRGWRTAGSSSPWSPGSTSGTRPTRRPDISNFCRRTRGIGP